MQPDPSRPLFALRIVVLTLGWLLSACSGDDAPTQESGSGTAGAAAIGGSGASGSVPTAGSAGASGGAGGRSAQGQAPAGAAGQSGVAGASVSAGAGGSPVAGAGAGTSGTSTAGTSGTSTAGSGSPAQASAGCGLEPKAAGPATIQVDGMERTYEFSLPTGYDKNRPYPLVFGFHGAGVEVPRFRMYFDMTTVVGADAIVVYPAALGMAWNVQRDVPLFDALLTQFKAENCVDEKRVFAAGHSSGGFFSHALGCQRGDLLRGIGPLSAGPPSGTCVGQIAVWISHGNADPTVNVSSGQSARDFWAEKNHCDTAMSMPVDPAPTVEYAGCDAGFAVRYCEYDGEHNLPRYAPKGIWDFFKTL